MEKKKNLKKKKIQKRIKMKSKLIQKMKQLKRKKTKKEKKHLYELLLKNQIRCKQLAAQLTLMATELRKLMQETQNL